MVHVLVVLADGSEEIEALTIANVLRRGGAQVELASAGKDTTIVGSRNIKIVCDKLLDECQHTDYDMIALPGGLPGAQNLSDSATLTSMLKQQNTKGKYIAAICASPALILAKHQLLAGHTATCYPSFSSKLEHYEDKTVVVSKNIITSQGPATAMEFGVKLVEILKGKQEAKRVAEGLLLKSYC